MAQLLKLAEAISYTIDKMTCFYPLCSVPCPHTLIGLWLLNTITHISWVKRSILRLSSNNSISICPYLVNESK